MAVVTMALAVMGIAAPVAPADDGCSRACEVRVQKREIEQRWRQVVHRYGVGLLRARARCETGSHGMYRLSTTGNTYWFAHQMNVAAWIGAGGHMRDGRPVGVWTTQPTRLEQDYRTVRWDRMHGGDPWPNCP